MVCHDWQECINLDSWLLVGVTMSSFDQNKRHNKIIQLMIYNFLILVDFRLVRLKRHLDY